MHTETGHQFTRATAGLPRAEASRVIEVADGGRVELRIAPATKQIGDATVRMLAYNGSIPGPTLRVRAGLGDRRSTSSTTATWRRPCTGTGCGWRTATTAPTRPRRRSRSAGASRARVAFPDPGVYWYHPHIREDYGQEMGLYGNVLVDPAGPRLLGAGATARSLLTLDDMLIEDGQIAPFSRSETNYAAMGRFGNVLLVAGEPELALTAKRGEVVRLYLTNTANTRVFKVEAAGRADEARRRRQRPRRAGGVRRGGRAGAVRARRRRRAVRRSPASSRWSTARPSASTSWRRSRSSEEPAEPSLGEAFDDAAQRPGAQRRARARSRRW